MVAKNSAVQAEVEQYKKIARKILGSRLTWKTHAPDCIHKGKLLLSMDVCTREQIDLLCAGYRILGLDVVYREPYFEVDTHWLIAFLIDHSINVNTDGLLVFITGDAER